MKTENNLVKTWQVHDLANPHFQQAEIITVDGTRIKGSFVSFRVNQNGEGDRIYPSEKLCFLPLENKKDFWEAYKANQGVFDELPAYIMEMSLDQVKRIILEPVLIV